MSYSMTSSDSSVFSDIHLSQEALDEDSAKSIIKGGETLEKMEKKEPQVAVLKSHLT